MQFLEVERKAPVNVNVYLIKAQELRAGSLLCSCLSIDIAEKQVLPCSMFVGERVTSI